MLRLAVAVIVLSAPAVASAQFQSKFGDEWPALQECLEYSDDSGEWGSGGVTCRFYGNGNFSASYTSDYVNRLFRRKTRSFLFTGTWKLTHRPLQTDEKQKIGLPSEHRNRVYLLELTFTDVGVDPAFPPDAKLPPLIPAADGGTLNHRAVLVLDEQTRYRLPGRETQGASSPLYLHWIVLEDALPFFPRNTAIGKSAWTMIHK